MKNSSAFKLNGKPFSLRPVKPAVLKIRNFVSGMKNGELLTTPELAKTLGYSVDGLQADSCTRDEVLLDFRARVRYPTVCIVWGNAKTIRELLKHKELCA